MSDVGVLDKVMAVLSLFSDGSTRLQPPVVARELGIAPATGYRLMKAMAVHGLLDHDADGYRLGVTLLHLGARVAEGLDVRRAARPQLERLRDETGENAELHLRHGVTRVPVAVVPSPQNLRPLGQVGVPFPLSGGASAKVLLAWLPAEERQAVARASYERFRPTATFDAEAFERELLRTRDQEYAVSDGEREVGIGSVAAPVHDRVGSVVAAVVLAGPSSRLMRPEALEVAVSSTREAARRTSEALGQQRPTADSTEVAHA